MLLGILSDTHNLLRPEAADALKDCDAILHGGDVCSPSLLGELKALAPVWAVRGNGDRDWPDPLPERLDFVLGGLRIVMAHKQKDLPSDLSPYDLAVFGHSHQYSASFTSRKGGGQTLVLNPGSCGPRRFAQPVTLCRLTADGSGLHPLRVDLASFRPSAAPPPDLRRQIEIVMRETARGQSPESIARRFGMDPGLAGQIARLYVTHPGVTADGILTKMGL